MAPAHRHRDDVSLLTGTTADFAEFYARHERMVLAYFHRRTRRADLAADLTAETFARVVAGRRDFDPARGAPLAWLFGIARNVLLRSLERGRVEDATRRRLGMQPIVLDDADLAGIDEASADEALTALDALPADQAAAVTLRVIDELGYDELATRLRCSESVARKRVSRGLKRLRAEMEARS